MTLKQEADGNTQVVEARGDFSRFRLKMVSSGDTEEMGLRFT